MVAKSIARTVEIALTVNGERVEARVEAGRHLVDFLRLDLGLTGSHAGCEHGVCGACTLEVDGILVRGCLMLAAQLDGADVWTIEGASETKAIRDLQDAFVARNALQCGFCTPGMLIAAKALLDESPSPDRAMIREYLGGNYCRCTGYEAIIDAIQTVAEARAKSPTPGDAA
ncbi:(2Fe-2S)-binding protein [Aurantimonas marianensis]|uniref:(2Fe-2S)-binding protein n=1 Tax=Aurantimonas marianensis TaxID=2920428 RepID=A0A9X2H5R9_9HYPH|nr:(2Fe-2S)-binding protein [Aurantimonas marianensis]MCP3055807.1 (2Fe-2S)-binding protein [Aurantimonas marianensis]